MSQFLAIAVSRRVLTRAKAVRAHQQQRQQREAGVSRRIGEVCCDLGLMSSTDCQQILEEQEKGAASLDERLPDPVSSRSRFTELYLPSPFHKAIASLAMLLLVVLGYWLRGWQGVAFVSGVVPVLAGAVINIIPLGVHGSIAWYRIPRWCFLIGGLISVGYAAVLLWDLHAIVSATTGGAVAGIHSLVRRISWAGALVVVGAGFFVLAAAWLRHELRCVRARGDLTYRLVRLSHDGVESNVGGSRESRLQSLLTTAANLFELDPWARSRFRRLWGSSSGVSLWYTEPDAERPAGSRFTIRAFAAPAAPSRVLDLYGRIRDEFHPAAFDRERFEAAEHSAAEAAAGNGRMLDSTFEAILNAAAESSQGPFISISGYVFERQVGAIWQDSKRCRGLARHYYGKLPIHHLEPQERIWLKFDCFEAYPVFSCRRSGGRRPIGVLIAFSHRKPAGLTPDDSVGLMTTAQLIGVLLDGSVPESLEGVEPK